MRTPESTLETARAQSSASGPLLTLNLGRGIAQVTSASIVKARPYTEVVVTESIDRLIGVIDELRASGSVAGAQTDVGKTVGSSIWRELQLPYITHTVDRLGWICVR